MTEIKLKNTKVASAESAGSGKFGRLLVAALAGGALLLSGCAGENKAQPTQQSQNQHEKQQNSQQNKPSEQKPSEQKPGDQSSKPSSEQDKQRQALLSLADRKQSDVAAYGKVDAPVVVTIYSDYQCSFCKRFVESTLDDLQKRADAGEIRIEQREINFYGEKSRAGALGSYAAGKQGKFWEFHKALFKNKDKLSRDGLVALAKQMGLDGGKFAADYDSQEAKDVINQHESNARSVGVRGTPSFVIGGQAFSGAQPLEHFNKVIDEELTRAKHS